MFQTNYNQSLPVKLSSKSLSKQQLIAAHKIYEYDAFVSYDQSCQDKLVKFSNLLANGLNLNVTLDLPEIELSMKRKYNKIIQKMIRSRLVICCVNRCFLKSQKCKDELIIAYTYSKPIIILLLEDMRLTELEFVDFLSKGGSKISAVQYFESNGPENILFTTELTSAIERIIERKLKLSSHYNKPATIRGTPANHVNDDNQNENDPQYSIDDDSSSTLEYEKVTTGYDSFYERIFLNPNLVDLKLFNNSNMIQFAFGFNRIIYMETKERFLITSSYFKVR